MAAPRIAATVPGANLGAAELSAICRTAAFGVRFCPAIDPDINTLAADRSTELDLQIDTLASATAQPGTLQWCSKQDPNQPPTFKLFSDDYTHWLQVSCQGRGWFRYDETSVGIFWEPGGSSFEHYCFGLGLAIALELRGVTCLHGSAVRGDSQAGKSTLTAALVSTGAKLLSDDLLLLYPHNESWRAYPSSESVRLWPDSAAHLCVTHEPGLQRVHAQFDKRLARLGTDIDGSAAPTASELDCIYRLQPSAGPITPSISSLAPIDAVQVLLQQSLAAMPAKALGLEGSRFLTICALATQVPIKQLQFAHDYTQLARLCALLRSDIESI